MDDKIIAVHADDPEFAHIENLEQIPEHRLKEISRFFQDYKANEHKQVGADAAACLKGGDRLCPRRVLALRA